MSARSTGPAGLADGGGNASVASVCVRAFYLLGFVIIHSVYRFGGKARSGVLL